MKDKRQVPMKGDRAMIIYAHAGLIGRIVQVMSDPEWRPSKGPTGKIVEGYHNFIERISWNGWDAWVCPTEWLLRIPPDSEMKTMFGETEKPNFAPSEYPDLVSE